MKRDGRRLDDVLNLAAGYLPDGCELIVEIEKGSGGVKILRNGEAEPFDHGHLSEVGLAGVAAAALEHLGVAEPEEYFILDLDTCRGDILVFWGTDRSGYTSKVREAGRYTAEEVAGRRSLLDDGVKTKAISCRMVEEAADRYVPGGYETLVEFGAEWPKGGEITWAAPAGGEASVDEPGPDEASQAEPWWDRLAFDHEVSDSSPVVKGTCVTAARVVALIIEGKINHDIIRDHPELTEDDIRACVSYSLASMEPSP